ncbi:hypothetical protein Clacol_003474 [Clathrus columnatus]|uniref:Uncharacterized protein n=1 Tax=Clathrus columnatus TaxID=1419009 RepID=A0AAV5A6X1_9AGAM|nr:hypothetical protein Clacol_003474 [Clathrus columnatus]
MNRIKFNLKTRAPIVERTDKPPCEIEKDIKLDPKTSTDEKKKMMELLHKFEEESLKQPDLLMEDKELADEDEDDLVSKLEDLDLDETDPDTLWSLLSPSQREKFLKAMRDPSSELAVELLAADELSKHQVSPWWESPALQTDETTVNGPEPLNLTVRYGAVPDMISVPEQLIASARGSSASLSNVTLLYNILATCLAYAYVTRKLLTSPLSSIKVADPDRKIARDLFGQVAPFLTEKRSTLAFNSVDDLVTFFWSKFDSLSDTPTDTSVAKLLSDAALLLKPQLITTISSDDTTSTSSPSRTTLLVLSDISRLFTDIKYISHKLNFYAAQLCVYDLPTLKAVSEEAQITALQMQSQAQNHHIPATS